MRRDAAQCVVAVCSSVDYQSLYDIVLSSLFSILSSDACNEDEKRGALACLSAIASHTANFTEDPFGPYIPKAYNTIISYIDNDSVSHSLLSSSLEVLLSLVNRLACPSDVLWASAPSNSEIMTKLCFSLISKKPERVSQHAVALRCLVYLVCYQFAVVRKACMMYYADHAPDNNVFGLWSWLLPSLRHTDPLVQGSALHVLASVCIGYGSRINRELDVSSSSSLTDVLVDPAPVALLREVYDHRSVESSRTRALWIGAASRTIRLLTCHPCDICVCTVKKFGCTEIIGAKTPDKTTWSDWLEYFTNGLLDVVHDPYWKVVVDAADALTHMDFDLIQSNVRECSVRDLHKFDDIPRRVLSFLMECLHHNDSRVRDAVSSYIADFAAKNYRWDIPSHAHFQPSLFDVVPDLPMYSHSGADRVLTMLISNMHVNYRGYIEAMNDLITKFSLPPDSNVPFDASSGTLFDCSVSCSDFDPYPCTSGALMPYLSWYLPNPMSSYAVDVVQSLLCLVEFDTVMTVDIALHSLALRCIGGVLRSCPIDMIGNDLYRRVLVHFIRLLTTFSNIESDTPVEQKSVDIPTVGPQLEAGVASVDRPVLSIGTTSEHPNTSGLDELSLTSSPCYTSLSQALVAARNTSNMSSAVSQRMSSQSDTETISVVDETGYGHMSIHGIYKDTPYTWQRNDKEIDINRQQTAYQDVGVYNEFRASALKSLALALTVRSPWNVLDLYRETIADLLVSIIDAPSKRNAPMVLDDQTLIGLSCVCRTLFVSVYPGADRVIHHTLSSLRPKHVPFKYKIANYCDWFVLSGSIVKSAAKYVCCVILCYF